jgi:hypothetical protein
MKNIVKLFRFHLEGGMKNKYTLVCNLVDGDIKYRLYGGHGSSGFPCALKNIQFYDVVNGDMCWKRGHSLPVDTLQDETKEDFKYRVKDMLYNSTYPVVGEVSTNVTFA